MSGRMLAVVVLLVLSAPWAISVLTPGTVGMYADPRHVLFSGDSDVYDCLWHFRWAGDRAGSMSDPRVYHGRTLAWNNMAWPDLLLAVIAGWGYQTSLLAATVFSALAGYLFARAWGLGRTASVIAGLIIAWMPVRTIRMYQHYPVASVGYALVALAMVRRLLTGAGAGHAFLCAAFSALAVAESFQHGFTIALGWFLTVIFSRWRGWKTTLLSGVIPGLGCIAGAMWPLTSPGLTGTDPGKDWRESVFWGAEVQSYFLPSFLGRHIIADYMPNPFEGVVTPGLTVIAAAGAWCVRKKRYFPALAALGVMVLSVGPLFKFLGTPTPVPLPYMLIAKTPWLSAARAPARLGIIVGFMAALGAGAFIAGIPGKKGWLPLGLILLEITPIPLRKIQDGVPAFYTGGTASGMRLEIPASHFIRRYALFEAADGVERRVKFFARGGEDMMEGIPEGLRWNPSEPPSREDLSGTGADEVIYNRWILPPGERALYDSLYAGVFLREEKGDSLWISRACENGP